MVGVCACCSLNYWRPHKSGFLFVLNQMSFVSTTFKYAAALMLRVDHTKYDDGSEQMLGWMLITIDMSFLVCGVLCMFIAVYVLSRRIKHLSKIKSRMRILARTASRMDMTATSREQLAQWKVPPEETQKKNGGGNGGNGGNGGGRTKVLPSSSVEKE